MYISEVKLENWLNFGEETSAKLEDVSYVLGVNASGKSNFLDALRFLRDVANPIGGGLQYAINERGGMKKIRCLHARGKTEVSIEVTLAKNATTPAWRYRLSFNNPSSGIRGPLITQEVVSQYKNGKWKELLNRPNGGDKEDSYTLSETYIEQKRENLKFRELVDFLAGTTYYHLVPQLLQFANKIGGELLRNDPFGQDFLRRVADTPEKIRTVRLNKIEQALKGIMPYFNDLQFVHDKNSGRPHLEIRYQHHRPNGAKQREDSFSDGTLRLIGLLWVVQENGKSPLLLEEPELSLNEEIIKEIPIMIDRIMRVQKSDRRRQVIITTHSRALLSNPGISHKQITVIEPGKEGSSIRPASKPEMIAIEAGFPPAAVVIPALNQEHLDIDF